MTNLDTATVQTRVESPGFGRHSAPSTPWFEGSGVHWCLTSLLRIILSSNCNFQREYDELLP